MFRRNLRKKPTVTRQKRRSTSLLCTKCMLISMPTSMNANANKSTHWAMAEPPNEAPHRTLLFRAGHVFF